MCMCECRYLSFRSQSLGSPVTTKLYIDVAQGDILNKTLFNQIFGLN